MKKLLLYFVSVWFLSNFVQAQDIIIEGDITSSTTLTANNSYLLRGFVRVQAPAVLTIEAGTLIYGENSTQGSLIIKPGAKIMAMGTESKPIIFTSEFAKLGSSTTPNYGDWGGIILLGNAKINVPGGTALIEGPGDEYGGNDDSDNSGEMHYVRIEYPGIAFSLNNEINGLTFGGVGNGTLIDHIQVSYSGDDSYEWFGGTVNCKYLIAYRGWDDDFDTDFGFRGKLQFLVSLRDPDIADQSGSNGFESDNDGSGSLNEPRTSPTWWNVSIFGPLAETSSIVNANYKRGMHLRRSSQNKISNALIAGWPTGVRLDGQYTIQGAINGDMWLDNSVVSGWNTVDLDTVSAANQSFDVHSWFGNAGGRTYANNSDLQLNDPFNLTNPNFLPKAGSQLLNGAATPPNDGFFDITGTFVGAFGFTDWTLVWSNFNPGGYVTAVEESGTGLVSDFRLEQNFPNPFNPSTTIRFVIPISGNVKLSVTNILGQEVAVLLNEFKNAGSYDINFDASKISSGLYIYKIETKGIVISKKMTLLK